MTRPLLVKQAPGSQAKASSTGRWGREEETAGTWLGDTALLKLGHRIWLLSQPRESYKAIKQRAESLPQPQTKSPYQ